MARSGAARWWWIGLAAVVTSAVLAVATWTPAIALWRYRAAPRRVVLPIAGLAASRVHSSWGEPRSGGRRHQGIDLFAPRGTPVVSATAGEILRVGQDPLGGNLVWVVGEGASLYYYAHLHAFHPLARVGRRVVAGDVLGYVGNTGNARTTPPHLHFGIYPLATTFAPIDPAPFLLERTTR